MHHRILIVILVFLSAAFQPLAGQDTKSLLWGSYSFFQDAHPIRDQGTDGLFFRFNNSNFFKNNEYRNNLIKGQTLFGTFAEPQLEYYAGKKTRLSAGVHLMKFYGTDSFDRVLPLFAIRHQVNDHLDLIFGSLEGTTNHGLLEPISGFENYLTRHPESGIQILLNYSRLKGDFWLNWEQFIKQDDPFQEHFTAGGHLMASLIKTDQWDFQFDLQMVFRHQGGEIDLSDLPAITSGNLSQGIQITRKLGSSAFKEIGFHYNLLEAICINPPESENYKSGTGHYPMLALDTKLGSFRAGYWWGQSYFSPHGEALFLTQSQYQSFSQTNRQMLTFNFQKTKQLGPSLKMGLSIDAYYHTDTGRLDHAWGLYLLFDKDFFLSRIKDYQ